MCAVLDCSNENLKICAKRIRDGKLVAFPTETVYGLGANALDAEAAVSIFDMKKRPRTDPLIVHVTCVAEMEPLVVLTPRQRTIVNHLAAKFWPGPLTMIMKASELIPNEITAGTGFVGIRVPNHKTALQFLNECGVPIAAPSANLFNHVSPTLAAHVYEDFRHNNLVVLDDGCATLGIESTVIKVENDKLGFLRLGSLPKQEIENFVRSIDEISDLQVEYVQRRKSEHEKCEAPGQFVKHYSPYIKTYIIGNKELDKTINNDELASAVIIDFNEKYKYLDSKVLKRVSLSSSGSLKEAMFKLYYCLRVAESVESAKVILIINLVDIDWDTSRPDYKYFDAVYDKVYRAASGEYIYLPLIN